MKPKVTVLTTVYNGLPHLKSAIDSTLAQTYTNFEYMIIDDASPDESVAKFIESYDDPRINFIKNDQNLGVSETINKALSLITTPYVVRVDQDDVNLPQRVEDQINYLEANPDLSIVCSWEQTIDSEGKKIRNWKKSIKNYGEFLGPVLLGLCPIWHPSIAFKTQALIDVGGFNGSYIRAEDFEVTARLATKRHGAAILQNYHLLKREHEQSQSIEFLQDQTNMSAVIQKEAIAKFLSDDESEELARFLRLELDNASLVKKKKQIICNYNLLIKMIQNINEKQKLDHQERFTLKRVIFSRLGLAVYLLPLYKILPTFLFFCIFYSFSPLYSNAIHKLLSRIYNRFKELRYFFK